MDITEMISRMSFRPIKSLNVQSQNSLRFFITFEDGFMAYQKDSVGLRMWASCIQHFQFQPIFGDTEHCTKEPLNYYNLLGFRSGDAVLVRNEKGNEMPILFS